MRRVLGAAAALLTLSQTACDDGGGYAYRDPATGQVRMLSRSEAGLMTALGLIAAQSSAPTAEPGGQSGRLGPGGTLNYNQGGRRRTIFPGAGMYSSSD